MTAVASPLRPGHQPSGRGGRPTARLHAVGPGNRRGTTGIRRARLLLCSATVVVVACLLGLVASHVALAQGQFRLDKMQQRAAAEQARYERLRLRAAELESPSRVVAAAQERLGMVPSPGLTYLSPTGPASGHAPPAPDDEQAAATEDWSKVKRQLTSPTRR
ncbi:MAG: hypothetical protein M3396_05680 [Actinomycetota bacterium]|nr:hypothetical protein [Actinomycetota bacterium]MDQ3575315.1 hypothetical protein [Actinomycetota bacterium]